MKPSPDKISDTSDIICRKCGYQGPAEVGKSKDSFISRILQAITLVLGPQRRVRQPGTVTYDTHIKLQDGKFICPKCSSSNVDFQV
ncbi:MAG: hypothetical protein ACXAE3_07095 [Candidatus Kariarchaeaceae archaeon]